MEFGKKADRVQVVIKPDVPPGRHFLRMAKPGRRVRCFRSWCLHAEVSEKEPNGRIADAQNLTRPPGCQWRAVRVRDVDTFGFHSRLVRLSLCR
ncbi:MAG: hypothetical protein Ct9H300mP1_15850 [Planctomycetaceae bacterium]|nr:MAG: hypothetical protein Ct9H300mP1_15850 [Planctomycetaceae bacterium]